MFFYERLRVTFYTLGPRLPFSAGSQNSSIKYEKETNFYNHNLCRPTGLFISKKDIKKVFYKINSLTKVFRFK